MVCEDRDVTKRIEGIMMDVENSKIYSILRKDLSRIEEYSKEQ